MKEIVNIRVERSETDRKTVEKNQQNLNWFFERGIILINLQLDQKTKREKKLILPK